MNTKICSTLVLFLSLIAVPVSAETFNTSGSATWTAPVDAQKVRIEVWGGGGAGGSGYKTKNHHVSGFGGGAGGYASKEIVVTPGDAFQITVGRGGEYNGGGSNSEVTKDGTVVVGAGGGGSGMSGGAAGASASGPGAGAGGTNISYVQKGSTINEYDNKYGGGGDGNTYLNFIQNLFSVTKVFAQDVPPAEPTFDTSYVGVAGQGGRGYAGDTMTKGSDGGPYSSVGGNPYASSGGSAPNGGAGGSRGRLGRDGTGHGSQTDAWAKDGDVPGAGGGGSDTGPGAWGASGRVAITVIETLPPTTDECLNIAGNQTEVPAGKVADGNGNCIEPVDTLPDDDMCLNIDGLQATVPAGYTRYANGNCLPNLPPPTTEENFNPKGWLENASCSAISGWAYDGDIPSSSINVHLYDGPASYGRIITSLSTAQYRADVNAAEGIVGNHGFGYATPASLKNGADHLIYAYGINNTSTAANTQLLGSPILLNCPPVLPTVGVVPAVTVSANPTTLTTPGTTQLSWVSANINSSTNVCTTSWSSGAKGSSGTETSPVISSTSTFVVTCTSASGGVGSGSVTVSFAPVVVVVNNPVEGNGIIYNSIPSSVAAGQSFSITATNSGTKTWGSNHQLVLSTQDLSNGLSSVNLGTTVSKASKTLTMTAPTTPGSYVIRALEHNVEWFGTPQSLTVTTAPPVVVVNSPVIPAASSCDQVSAVPTVTTSPGFPPIGGGGGVYRKGSTAVVQWVSASYTGFFADEREPISCSGTNISPDSHVYRNINTTIPNVSEGSSASGSCGNSKGSSNISVSFKCFVPGIPGAPGGGAAPVCTGGKVVSGAGCACPSNTPVEIAGTCVSPDFTLSAIPVEGVKVKSVAGYSGATEQVITITANPVSGFNGPVTISVMSDLAAFDPEYSVNGGPFSKTFAPATLNSGGVPYLQVKLRFGKKIGSTTYPLTFKAVGKDSRSSATLTRTAVVNLDSRPLYPGYTEI